MDWNPTSSHGQAARRPGAAEPAPGAWPDVAPGRRSRATPGGERVEPGENAEKNVGKNGNI